MTDTVSTAVAKAENGPGAMIKRYSADFTTVLPSHIKGSTWIRLAQGALRRDKNLARIATNNPGSLMQALLECARLGHEPGTEAFYLVPMGNEIEGWEGYRGVIERMYRAGAVTSVKAEVVKANDRFNYQPHMSRPDHHVDWFGDRGEVVGAYAYAEMVGGATSKVVVIDRTYIAKVRAMSRGSDKSSSPWKKWEESMVLKTVVHRLEPFVPTSAEYRATVARAEQAAIPTAAGQAPADGGFAPSIDVSDLPEVSDDGDVLDGEVVDRWDEVTDAEQDHADDDARGES
jgi:recombination protein RecT